MNVEWIAILAGLALFAGVGLGIFRAWRKTHQEDENQKRIFDLVEHVISTLRAVVRDTMQTVPLDVVEDTAAYVYDQFIVGTPLAVFVTKQAFVTLVVTQWNRLAGVEQTVLSLCQARQLRIA